MRSDVRSPVALVHEYTDLHEGRLPDKIRKGKTLQELGLPKLPKSLIDLGPFYAGPYFKATNEPEIHPYSHPFEDWAMPTLARDENGKLWILDQENVETRKRGIEDVMAKRTERSIAGSRFIDPRHNPFGIETLKKVGMSAGAVGLGASATMILMGVLMDWVATKWRVAPATGASATDIAALNTGVPAAVIAADGATPKVPMLTGYKRSAAEAIIGVIVATGVQSLVKGNGSTGDNIAEVVAASIGIGGVAAAANGAYVTYKQNNPPAQGLFFSSVAAPRRAA
jgi:hypothetical protein